MNAFLLLDLLVVSGIVFAGFVRLERSGRREIAVIITLFIVAIEVAIAPSIQNVPQGSLLRPVIAGQDFRPPDFILVAAVGARLWVQPTLARFSATAAAWAVFLTWYTSFAVKGYTEGFGISTIGFQGKFVLYIGAGAILCAGLDLRRLLRHRAIDVLIVLVGITSVVLTVMSLIRFNIQFSLPGNTPIVFGRVTADSSTVLFVVTIPFLMAELSRPRPRLGYAVAAAAPILLPAGGEQRAAYLSTVVIVLVAGGFALTGTGRRRIRITGTEAALCFTVVLAVGAVALNTGAADVDVVARFEETFFSDTEETTTNQRQVLLDDAFTLIAEQPVLGYGVGFEIERVLPGRFEVGRYSSHNLLTDIALRTGLFGPFVFMIAAALTAFDARRAWRRHVDPMVAALAAGCVAGLAGILIKGMVEPVIEKFRMTTLVGLYVGIIMAAVRESRDERASIETAESGDTAALAR